VWILRVFINLQSSFCDFIVQAKGSVQPTHTRLPMKLFHDISHGGSLCQIIRTGLQCKQDLDLKRLEFSERYVEQFEELMLRVEDALVAQHMYRKPHVFFSSSIDADTIAQLKALVRAKGGTISTSEGAATHVPNWSFPSIQFRSRFLTCVSVFRSSHPLCQSMNPKRAKTFCGPSRR
jgi:hypothetical protein